MPKVSRSLLNNTPSKGPLLVRLSPSDVCTVYIPSNSDAKLPAWKLYHTSRPPPLTHRPNATISFHRVEKNLLFTLHNKRRRNTCFACIACAYFYLAGLVFIPHIGIEGDETLFAAGLYRPRGELFALHIGQSHVPIMLMSYVGALKSWIYRPILDVFGAGPMTLRVPMLLAGVASLWLFFLVLRRVAGERSALIGCGLLAVDSMYLVTTCFDWGPVALQHLLLAGWHVPVGPVLSGAESLAAFLGILLSGPDDLGQGAGSLDVKRYGDRCHFDTSAPNCCHGDIPLARNRRVGICFGSRAADRLQCRAPMGHLWRQFPSRYFPGCCQGRLSGNHSGRSRTLRLDDFRRLENACAPPAGGLSVEGFCRDFGTCRASASSPPALCLRAGPPADAVGPRRRPASHRLFADCDGGGVGANGGHDQHRPQRVHHTILLWPLPQVVIAVSFASASRRLGRAGIPALAATLWQS